MIRWIFTFACLFFSLLIVLFYYFWISTAGYNYFDFVSNHRSYYGALAQSLIHGSSSLLIDPHPALLSLIDPYDPIANAPYRVHDLSLYKGKYYMYFGITPALLVYIPYFLLTGRGIPDNFVVFLFSFLGYLFSAFLLFHIKNKYYKELPSYLFLLPLLLLAPCNITPWLMQRPNVYEVSIASGFCFLMGGIYFICLSLSQSSIKSWLLGLSSLFLGLSIGCRPHYFFTCFVIIIIIIGKIVFFMPNTNLSHKLSWIRFLILPFLVCLIFLACYNYVRFDNPFEFGIKYQLPAHRFPKGLSVNSFVANAYLCLFNEFRLSSLFPFIYPERANIPPSINVPNYYYTVIAPMAGFFSIVPFLIVSVLAPVVLALYLIFLRFSKRAVNFSLFPWNLDFLILFIAAILSFLILCLWSGVLVRFYVDFASFFILVTCFLFYYLISTLNTSKVLKGIIEITVVFLIVTSIVFGTLFSFQGEHGGLKTRNPALYVKLLRFTKPISVFVLKFFI